MRIGVGSQEVEDHTDSVDPVQVEERHAAFAPGVYSDDGELSAISACESCVDRVAEAKGSSLYSSSQLDPRDDLGTMPTTCEGSMLEPSFLSASSNGPSESNPSSKCCNQLLPVVRWLRRLLRSKRAAIGQMEEHERSLESEVSDAWEELFAKEEKAHLAELHHRVVEKERKMRML